MNDDLRIKIRFFTDLIAWKEGHKLVILVYKTTSYFPNQETFLLSIQMRRAAISVTSNIAEGFGRQGYKEKLQFYYLAQGSLTELKNQALIARDIDYLSSQEFDRLFDQANIAHSLLQGLIKKTKSFINHKS